MALKKDMLAPDEQVVLHLRTHLKSLIGAILTLLLASALLTIFLVDRKSTRLNSSHLR